MKQLIILAALAGAMAHAQTVSISDTIKTPNNTNWTGTVTVTLNNPATAQPLYSGSVTLSGWSQTVTVTDGAFSITLYANDAITPTGTSYTARYTPTSGSAWSETWVVPTGATTIRELRSTTVPTPRTMFTPSQITQAGAALNNVLRWNGSNWAPFASILTDPMTTTGDIIYRTGGVPARLPIGSTGQVLTVTGGAPAWAGLASTGLTDSAGLVRGAAALTTAGRVPYVSSAGTVTSESGMTYDATKNALSLEYPVDVFDDFSGTAGAALNGRMPTVGPYAWASSGPGAADAYAGNGVMGVSSNNNTYFIARGASTPYEITVTMRRSDSAPSTTISIVKDYPTWGFGVMWHVVYSSTGIGHLYWNLIANGGAADVTTVSPVSENNSVGTPGLAANTDYVCRLTINGPHSDASIETTDGVVLFRSRAYDPLLSTLLGPWVYVQSGVSTQTLSNFRMTTRPPKPSLDYGRFVSGIDGTPIGTLAPSPGFFSSLTVGGTKQAGVFTVNYNGNVGKQPRITGNNTHGVFRIDSDTSGFASSLEIVNGAGAVGTIQVNSAFELTLSGNSGTVFLTKAANAGLPFFASSVGFNAASGQGIGFSSSGVLEVNNGTTGTYRDLRVRDLFQNGTSNTAVFGGQALTTAGWIPFVSSTGVLTGSSAFTYSSANNLLNVGRGSFDGALRSTNSTPFTTGAGVELEYNAGLATGFVTAFDRGGSTWQPIAIRGSLIAFSPSGTERGRFAPTTGNFLLNTTSDDGSNRFQINGNLRIGGAAEPTCSVTTRGTLALVAGGTGVKDTVRICAKDAGDAYAYRTIY